MRTITLQVFSMIVKKLSKSTQLMLRRFCIRSTRMKDSKLRRD